MTTHASTWTWLFGTLVGRIYRFFARTLSVRSRTAPRPSSLSTTTALDREPRGSQLELPGLADQVVAEAVMRLLLDQPIAGLFVEVPGGMEHTVRPEDDLPIT